MFRINSGLSLATYRSSFHAWQRHSTCVAEGKRIRSAANDAAGLSIAPKMYARIRGSRMHTRNLQDQLSMLQTAESALGESIHLLHRLRELAVQAGSVLTPRGQGCSLPGGVRHPGRSAHPFHQHHLQREGVTGTAD